MKRKKEISVEEALRELETSSILKTIFIKKKEDENINNSSPSR